MNVTFFANGIVRQLEADSTRPLSDWASEVDLPLNLQCGGQGACHGCRVRLLSGTFQIGEQTVEAPCEAKACKTTVLSETAEVEIPGGSLLNMGECASADFYASRQNLFQGQENRDGQFGLAIDIGTTTVALLLVELSSGKILGRESAYNRQIELGTDVTSRISVCNEEGNLERLRHLIIRGTLLPMIETVASKRPHTLEHITEIVLSANTVMCHLALGLSPLSIGVIPFEPLKKVFPKQTAPDMGFECCPNATVQIVPAISGYVGGDIVSDLYISQPDQDGLELLVDIGTNGEIVLVNGSQMVATATAAGPAFEGAGLLHGERATTGIIDQITCHPDDSIEVHVIGNGSAAGLCGSAAIDFMATAFETGLLNSMGRFDLNRLKSADRLVVLNCHGIDVNACVLTRDSLLGEPILITEFDVSQILKAKAAVYAGIRTLIGESGYEISDVRRVILAGGFAAHLRVEHAITIGLLPELPLDLYDVIGNGSLAGAYAALGREEVFEEFLSLAQRPSALHLNEFDEFNDRYIDAMALPNVDSDEFPKTMERL